MEIEMGLDIKEQTPINNQSRINLLLPNLNHLNLHKMDRKIRNNNNKIITKMMKTVEMM